MIRFLWDENTSHDILRALRRLMPGVDVLTVQASPVAGQTDERIVEFALAEDRVIVTGDRNTLIGVVVKRVRSGEGHSGVIVLDSAHAPGAVAADLAIVAQALNRDELAGTLLFVPLK
ncbi:MAG: DUF5615 family PIN-like protein [Acidobacteria bacterium]|nr:DUF5615 family PIN-like protein [Acidobacteriota bacterium]